MLKSCLASTRLALAALSIGMILSACTLNLPQASEFLTPGGLLTPTPGPGSATASPTAAAQSSPTRSQAASATVTPAMAQATPSPSPRADSATPPPAVTPSPTAWCDRVEPGNPIDITIPDDTHMQPGQGFTKTWRLVNAGVCPWTKDYAVVLFSGKSFSAPRANALAQIVSPGDSVDISLDMIAPMIPGKYQSNWKLSNPQNQLFGIGPNGDAPFWVLIIVDPPDTATPAPITPTLTPTVAIASSGVALLALNDSLDLTADKVVQSPADIGLTTSPTGALLLEPEGQAHLGAFGAQEPGLADCQSAKLAQAPVDLTSIASGTFFCLTTRQGLPGWLRLVSSDTQDHTVSIEYLTWAIP